MAILIVGVRRLSKRNQTSNLLWKFPAVQARTEGPDRKESVDGVVKP